jgi:cytochrome c5
VDGLRRTFVLTCIGLAAVFAAGLGGQATPPVAAAAAAQGAAPEAAPPRAVLDKYCVTCHNARIKTAGLMLDRMDTARIGDAAETWEKVARKLRTHEMPPPGITRPDAATYGSMTSWLETALDQASAAAPRPGRTPVHRLNRTEYANTVRDLLALEVDARTLLSADEPDQHGFDNVASVLSVSPALLENYLSAASTVSRLAVGDPTINPVVDVFKVPTALVQEERASESLPFGSRGGAVVRYQFPLDGEYSIKVVLKRQLYLYLMGMGEAHQIDLRLDGALLKRFSIGGEGKGLTAPESFAGNTQGDPGWEVYMHTADDGLQVRVPVKAGTHEVGVSFVSRQWEPEGVLQPPQRGFARTTNEVYFGNPSVAMISVGGPHTSTGAVDTPSRRKLFTCGPSSRSGATQRAARNGSGEEACARTILSTLGRRAYRRPLTDADVRTIMEFYRAGRAEGGFDAGIQRGVRRILSSPSFLFRVEREPANLAPGTPYRVSDIDLASRLSFFLWSSVPDDELLDAAVRGKLSDDAELERQVRRMLRDPRSQSLVDNFASQWLQLGRLAGTVPDADEYPEFDENLRDALLEETRLFVSNQLREDRSVVDLLSANYSYVNERLGRHYKIPNVYGSHFRRVTFTDGVRGGLLGQASIMTVTSYPNRTSPVVRGKWLLENVLGAPPPPPPPDVPALKNSGEDNQPHSVRERMEAHRKNPGCAVCHVRMDPLGFSLENFDALGKWRTVSDGAPIDASASLPDGTRFEGIAGLRALLLSHREDFVRTFTEKLTAYALGRGIEYYDLPAIRAVVRDAAAGDYRWSSLILGIAKSRPFTMSTSAAPTATPQSTSARR